MIFFNTKNKQTILQFLHKRFKSISGIIDKYLFKFFQLSFPWTNFIIMEVDDYMFEI